MTSDQLTGGSGGQLRMANSELKDAWSGGVSRPLFSPAGQEAWGGSSGTRGTTTPGEEGWAFRFGTAIGRDQGVGGDSESLFAARPNNPSTDPNPHGVIGSPPVAGTCTPLPVRYHTVYIRRV
jgi:hypothetical protein